MTWLRLMNHLRRKPSPQRLSVSPGSARDWKEELSKMSQEIPSSVPDAITLSTGDGDEIRIEATHELTHVPIAVVQKMEANMNELETQYRKATKVCGKQAFAIIIASQIISSLKSYNEECSYLGKGPLLGLISEYEKALRDTGLV